MATFDYQKASVYFGDGFVPFKEANLSIGSSAVLYGLTVYTVFGATWNEQQQTLHVFRLADHYRRLVNSARIMDFHSFEQAWPFEKFQATMIELLQRNHVKEDVLVRAAIYVDELIAGTRIHGLKHSFSAYAYPMGQILPKSGIHACVSSWQRTADNSIPSRAKINGSYINASLMKNEALLNGYDEAIAIDEHGHVAEGTVANLFMVRGDTLLTPDPATDILEGITRDTIIKLAKADGLKVTERSIDRSELYIADELFMCGSSARVIPVLSVDKRPINHQRVGPVTQRLAQLFQASQRGDQPSVNGWLTKVPN